MSFPADNIDSELLEIIEKDDCPEYIRVVAIAELDTRKDLRHIDCVLQKVYKAQIGTLGTLIASIILLIISKMV